MNPRRYATRLLAMIALVGALVFGATAPAAHADPLAGSYNVDAKVAPDGGLAVSATITFEGAPPDKLVQRLANTEDVIGARQYVFNISDVKATSGGKDLAAQVANDAGYTVITIPTSGLSAPVVLTYKVVGASRAQADGTTMLSWRFLQGLSVPVKSFDASVSAASAFLGLDCEAGPPASPGKCAYYQGGTETNPFPTFHDGPRGAGEVVLINIQYPGIGVKANDTVREQWTLDRAFSAGPLQLGLALGLLALGALALWAMHRRAGRDAAAVGDPVRVAEFTPVGAGVSEFNVLGGVRPGHVGTVADERVDPVDVTATILDLAVRGHLRITELPRTSEHGLTDWQFKRRDGDAAELAPFERTLLDAVAPTVGAPVKVSDIGPTISAVIPQVQSQLYDEVVDRGWFVARPDSTRNRFASMAWIALGVAVLATILLVAFTRFGLVGLVLIALALGLLFVAQEMPARTAEGVGLLAGLQALRGQLLSHPTNQMPAGREYGELSEILPYAVVLGGQDRWIKALVDADDDPDTEDPEDLDWYHAPPGWHLQDLPASLKNFVTTVQGNLFAR